MKKIKININGKETEITLTKEQLAQISDPMLDVYKYHNTTKEEIDKLYLNIPSYIKAYRQECMIVAYYNKGWIPNFKDNSPKYFLWFYLDNFRLNIVSDCYNYSFCSARLCFKNKADALEAFENFEDIFRESRTYS